MVLSKLTRQLDFNCYECAHTWNPQCSHIQLEALWDSYRGLFPLYLTLNSITYIMRYKGVPSLGRMISEVLQNSHQSASALGMCFFYLAIATCNVRRLLGFFSPWSLYAGTFVACLAGILLERDSRVRLYNIYMLQLVVETLTSLLQDHGVQGRLVNSATVLGLSVAVHMYLSRTSQVEKSNFSNWLRTIIGSRNESTDAKSVACSHRGRCVEHAVKRALFIGACGSMGSFGLRIATSLPRMHKIGFPSVFRDVLAKNSDQAAALGLALASFSALFNLVSCGLTHLEAKKSPWHVIPSSFIASWAADFFWPSQRVAIYALCNMMQDVYLEAVRMHIVPFHRLGSRLFFAHLCGLLLPLGVLKPHYVRKSYLDFLNKILGNRISLINWSAIAHLGFDSAKVYKEDLPQILDPAHVSQSFQQKMWIWSVDDFAFKRR